MSSAPLPDRLLDDQAFFVLCWEADAERMVLHIDDEDRSSYNLGGHPPDVLRLLIRWGLDEQLADRAIGQAREFSAVQVIPAQRRVINLIDRGPAARKIDPFSDSFAPKVVML
jgi:hypothetical protein